MTNSTIDAMTLRLTAAIDARSGLADEAHRSAYRLFNGYLEGLPGMIVDVYGTTAMIHDHSDASEIDPALLDATSALVLSSLPWLRSVIVKPRKHTDSVGRRGRVETGDADDVTTSVVEHGVSYALDLMIHRDASFYLDTRHLRKWAIENLAGARVLNTFAHTGSLGVAAKAGGAARVLNTDLNRHFLNVAKSSYVLNGFPIRAGDFVTGDFWRVTSALKRRSELFECVFVDPPIFSSTAHGTVDLFSEYHRVINKVRPLVAHGGRLVAVNNAKFVSGRAYVELLERLCSDGYLNVETIVPVPDDVIGYPTTRVGEEATDPAPFNNSTKIAILSVRRKDSRTR